MKIYHKVAEKFLSDNKAKCKIVYHSCDYHFPEDKQVRNIYYVHLSRNGKKYSFKFGDSIKNTEKGFEPSSYDVLSCLTKHEVGTYENFCADFGYDTDSIRATRIYKAVCREFKGVERIF